MASPGWAGEFSSRGRASVSRVGAACIEVKTCSVTATHGHLHKELGTRGHSPGACCPAPAAPEPALSVCFLAHLSKAERQTAEPEEGTTESPGGTGSGEALEGAQEARPHLHARRQPTRDHLRSTRQSLQNVCESHGRPSYSSFRFSVHLEFAKQKAGGRKSWQ